MNPNQEIIKLMQESKNITLDTLKNYVVVYWNYDKLKDDSDEEWMRKIDKIKQEDKKLIALQFHRLYFEFRDIFIVINSKLDGIFDLIKYSQDKENYLGLGLASRTLFETLGSLSHLILSTKKLFSNIKKANNWSDTNKILNEFGTYKRMYYGSGFFTTGFNRIHISDSNNELLNLVPGFKEVIVGKNPSQQKERCSIYGFERIKIIDENNIYSFLCDFVHPNLGSNVIIEKSNKLETIVESNSQSDFFKNTLSEIATLLVWVSIRLKLIFGTYTLYFFGLKDHLCYKEGDELDDETIKFHQEYQQPKIWCSPSNPHELISLNFELKDYFFPVHGEGKSKEKPFGWLGKPESQEKMVQDMLSDPLINKPKWWEIEKKEDVIENNYMYTTFTIINKKKIKDIFWFKRPYFRLEIQKLPINYCS